MAKPCDRYRDEAGFCHLQNRCWSDKPCPTTDAQAGQAWAELIAYHSRVLRTKEGICPSKVN